MKKILISALTILGVCSSTEFAQLKEVVKEASGSGPTQHQAISEALLIAVQSVNGTTVSQRVDMEYTVNMSLSNRQWSYSGKSSPIFSVDNSGSGSVSKFQVLNVTGSKNNYRAKVRAHVIQYQSSVQDQGQRRIAVLPFQFSEKNNRGLGDQSAREFSSELADNLGNYLSQTGQLSLVDRHYLEEMQSESEFILWDGAPKEMARLQQKVGADYLLVGRINNLAQDNGQTMYGLNYGAEQVNISWRVIEANTSKVVAAGNFNRNLSQNQVQNLLDNSVQSSGAEQFAESLADDVLVALKLKAKSASEGSNFVPTYEMTPGSSEQPIKW